MISFEKATAFLLFVLVSGCVVTDTVVEAGCSPLDWECSGSTCTGMEGANWDDWVFACVNSRWANVPNAVAPKVEHAFMDSSANFYAQGVCENDLGSYGSWGSRWTWLQLGDTAASGCYYRNDLSTAEKAREFWLKWRCGSPTGSPCNKHCDPADDLCDKWAGTGCTTCTGCTANCNGGSWNGWRK